MNKMHYYAMQPFLSQSSHVMEKLDDVDDKITDKSFIFC